MNDILTHIFFYISLFGVVTILLSPTAKYIDNKPYINEIISHENEKKIYIAVMSGSKLRDEMEFSYLKWYKNLLDSGNCTDVGFFVENKIKTLEFLKFFKYNLIKKEIKVLLLVKLLRTLL